MVAIFPVFCFLMPFQLSLYVDSLLPSPAVVAGVPDLGCPDRPLVIQSATYRLNDIFSAVMENS